MNRYIVLQDRQMSLEDKLIKVRQSLISLKGAGIFVTLSQWEQQRNLQILMLQLLPALSKLTKSEN